MNFFLTLAVLILAVANIESASECKLAILKTSLLFIKLIYYKLKMITTLCQDFVIKEMLILNHTAITTTDCIQ